MTPKTAHTVQMTHLAELDTLPTSKVRTALPRGVFIPDREWMVAPAASGLPARRAWAQSEGHETPGELPSDHRGRIIICDEMACHRRRSEAFGGDGEADGFEHVERHGASHRN